MASTDPYMSTEARARLAEIAAGINQTPNLSSLGYDSEYDSIKRKLDRALGLQQTQNQEDLATTEQDIGARRRNMEVQHPIDLKNILENFAGRGLAYSGRYISDQGDNENQYATGLSNLDTEKANRMSAINRALTNFQADQSNTLEDAQAAFAQRKAAQAEQDAAAATAANQQFMATLPPDQNINPATGTTNTLPSGQSPDQLAATAPDNYLLSGNDVLPDPGSQPLAMARTAAPVQTAAPKATTGQAALGVGSARPMSSFDAHSQNIMHGGGTVVAGNGYVYRSVNGVPTRVS